MANQAILRERIAGVKDSADQSIRTLHRRAVGDSSSRFVSQGDVAYDYGGMT